MEGQAFESLHKPGPIRSVLQAGVGQNQGIVDVNRHTALSVKGRAQMGDTFQIDGQSNITRDVAEEMRTRHAGRNSEIHCYPRYRAEQSDVGGRVDIPACTRSGI